MELPEDMPNTIVLNKIVISNEAKKSIAFAAELMAVAIRQLVDERGLKLCLHYKVEQLEPTIISSMERLINHKIFQQGE